MEKLQHKYQKDMKIIHKSHKNDTEKTLNSYTHHMRIHTSYTQDNTENRPAKSTDITQLAH